MITGMLWLDAGQSPLLEKISKAIEYYSKKYGRKPDMVLLNPSMFEKIEIDGVTIRPYRPILPGHIWVGNEDEPKGKQRDTKKTP